MTIGSDYRIREMTGPDTGSHDDMNMIVADRSPVADGVVLLTLRARDGAVPAWEPGAHIDLVLGGDLVRQYSLCGDPADRERLQVAVLREPESRGGSRHVHENLRAGDPVEVRGPRNNFRLVDAGSYLFIAGGIGITPLLPMIRQVEAARKPWRLLYGGRTRASMAFTDELTRLAPDRVVLRPQDEFGLLDLGSFLSGARDGTAVYCCGPEPLIAAAEEACRALPHVSLHVERFSPRTEEPEGIDRPFEVELRRSGRVVQVPADRSLLEVLQDEGVDIAFSCQEGTCGTCETTVLDGVPDHRDSLLTEDERAANDVIFPCVSRCASRRLVLDL